MSARSTERTEELTSDPVFIALTTVFVARVAVAVVLFAPFVFDPFALVKSVAGHVLSAMLLVLLAWLWARHGRATFGWSPLHVAVGALVMCFVAAAIFAVDPYVALYGVFRRFLGLTQILDQFVVYIAATVVVRSQTALLSAAIALLCGSAVVVAYGLVQAAGLDPVRYSRDTTHPISTLGNPDILAGYLSIAAATLLGIASLLWRSLPRALVVALLGVASGCVILLAITAVRNAVLGLGLGLVAVVVVGIVGRWMDRRVVTWLGVAAVAAVIIVALSPLGQRLTPAFLAQDTAGVQNRIEIWQAALAEVRERPILGVGPDNFAVQWPATRGPLSEAYIGPDEVETSAHSWVFYTLTSAGLLGLVALLTAIVMGGWLAIGLARRGEIAAIALVPLAAYLGQGLVDVNDVSLDWCLWVGLGLIAGATANPLSVTKQSRRSRRRVSVPRVSPAVGWAIVAVVALAGLLTEVPRVGASRSELLGEARLNAGAQADAIAPETDAVTQDARRAAYWSSLGTAFAGVNATAALSAFLTAAELEPWNRLHWLNVAILQRAVGNKTLALSAAQHAVALDPNSARARRLLASVLIDEERYTDAATQGETALRLYRAPEMYEEPILAYIRLERWDKAIALAREAVGFTQSPHYHLRLAQALTGAGQYAEAKRELALVLSASPDDAEAKDLAGFLASK